MQGAYFYQSENELPGMFDTLFGGLFVAKSIPILLQTSLILSLLFAIAVAYSHASAPTRSKRYGVWAFASVIFGCIFFMTVQPWDELFINLRHALHLSESGTFSFNRLTAIEGTVDFLPYALLGVAHKVGLPLLEGSLLLSLLGGILSWLAGYRILRAWKAPHVEAWGPLLVLAHVPLLYNSSQGFTASLFTAAILWASYFLFFNDRRGLGIFLLSVIPLIRLEGVWFVLLASLVGAKRQGVIAFVPVILLSIWRYRTFGSVIPIPIQYKNTLGSLFFLLIGVRNLLTDLIAGYSASIAALLVLCSVQWKKFNTKSKLFTAPQIQLLVIFILFEIPYYLSGGDWFPPHWQRYLLPLSCYLWILGLYAWSKAWTEGKSKDVHLFLIASFVILFIPFLWSQSSYRRLMNDLFLSRKFLGKTQTRYSPHARMQLLSQLGNHLKATTSAEQKIASSEVASIMFFAEREAVDLLGVANPRIAARPLRVPPPLFRKYPKSELPYSIFRRVDPTIVRETRPEYVYLFDFNVKDLFEDFQVKELDERTLFMALHRWQRRFVGLIAPLYGSVDELIANGYVPVVVLSGTDFCNLYFVSKEALPQHVKRLEQNGFRGGWLAKKD